MTVQGPYAGFAPPRVRRAGIHNMAGAFGPRPPFTPPAEQGAELRPLPGSHIYNCANRRGNGAGWCDLPRTQWLGPIFFFLSLSCSVHVTCFCGQCEVSVLHSLLGGRDVPPSGILLALQKGSKMSVHSAEVCKIHFQRVPAGCAGSRGVQKQIGDTEMSS